MNLEQLKQLENDLWAAADNLRANTDLKSSEYATPVLGLIFLKFADNKYRRAERTINTEHNKLLGTRREKPISEIAVEKCGFYLPDHARYDYLLNLSEDKDVAKAIKLAMQAIEEYKEELEGVLPKDEYALLTRTDKSVPASLLKNFSNIPKDANGDVFGKIYEYFLGNFALTEGQKGGEFFSHLGGSTDGGDHRTPQRHCLRSRLRFRRYVCAVTALCRTAPQTTQNPG